MQLPDDVLEMFAKASTEILEKEKAKGEIAERAHAAYTGLMSDLGYL